MIKGPMVRHARWELSQLSGPMCKLYERSMPWPGQVFRRPSAVSGDRKS